MEKVICYHCGAVVPRKEAKHQEHWYMGFRWLCFKCAEFRCSRCDILLSNDFKCPKCDKIHGRHTKKSLPLCLDCYENA